MKNNKKRPYTPPVTEIIPLCENLLAGYSKWRDPDGNVQQIREGEPPEGVTAKPVGPQLWDDDSWSTDDKGKTWSD